MQFNLLMSLGLREHHSLLYIGCGSLRGGRLFIMYLLPDRYYGIEPETWLLDEGIAKHLGRGLMSTSRPVFSNNANFTLTRGDDPNVTVRPHLYEGRGELPRS